MTALPSLDVDTLRERLITKEGQSLTATRGSLSKCTVRIREFLNALKDLKHRDSINNNDDDNNFKTFLATAASEVKRELKLHDLEMKKMALGCIACDAELSYYENIRSSTELSISLVRRDIEKLRLELVRSKKLKSRTEEYETLARMACRRPSVRNTKRKLELIEEDVQSTQKDIDRIQKTIQVKGTQFHLLMRSIDDLKNGVEEDYERNMVEKNRLTEDDIEEEEGFDDLPVADKNEFEQKHSNSELLEAERDYGNNYKKRKKDHDTAI